MMLTPQILNIIVGVSSVIGLVALLAYLFFLALNKRAEHTIRGLVEGDRLINSDQVLGILKDFKDDKARVEALQTLTRYDTRKAQALLGKLKGDVDIKLLGTMARSHYRQSAAAFAIVFFLLAALAVAFSVVTDGGGDPCRKEIPIDDRPVKCLEENK